MRYLLDKIADQGFKQVVVSTGATDDFEPARNMYIHCGFQEAYRFNREKDNFPMIEYTLSL